MKLINFLFLFFFNLVIWFIFLIDVAIENKKEEAVKKRFSSFHFIMSPAVEQNIIKRMKKQNVCKEFYAINSLSVFCLFVRLFCVLY